MKVTCPKCGSDQISLKQISRVGSSVSNICMSCRKIFAIGKTKWKKGSKIAAGIILSLFVLFIIGMVVGSKSSIDTQPQPLIASKKDSVATSKVDKKKIEALEKLMVKKKDEFNGVTWVQYKGSPKFRNSNGIYCMYAEDNSGVSNFRFVVQYLATEWLFIKSYDFAVDGQPFRSWQPTKVERDNNGENIWEWSNDAIDNKYTGIFIEGIANAHSAKIRFIGSQYTKDKAITKDQLEGIKAVFELFKSMGGTFE